jgi:hypothetical protein
VRNLILAHIWDAFGYLFQTGCDSSGVQLYRQMSGRHTPIILQNLWETPDNYLVLSSIIFNKASVSTLMVGTEQVE